MIDNPYRRKPAGTGLPPPGASALDFDAICLPDAVLLEAVIAAENRLMQETETQQQRRYQMGADSTHGSSMWQRTSGNAVARTISQVSSTSKSDDEASINDQRIAGSSRLKWEGEDEDFMVEDEQDLHPGALTQMVQEECQSEDRERQRLADHLVKMRMVMEKFVADQVQQRHISCKKGKKLFNQINALQKYGVVSTTFANHMHTLRDLGNRAAHGLPLPPEKNIQTAVQQYIDSRKCFESRQK